MRQNAKPVFGLSYAVFLSSAWNNANRTEPIGLTCEPSASAKGYNALAGSRLGQ